MIKPHTAARFNFVHPALRAAAVCAVTLTLTTGCDSTKKEERKLDFKAALNSFYGGRPRCLWPETVSFPAQMTPATTPGLDALVHAGLLAKNAKAKEYDLTAKGKSNWDADVLQQGYGNFCYGHRKVTSIDSSSRLNATTMQVKFHYDLIDPAEWARDSMIQEAFPVVESDLAGAQVAQADALDTDSGWEITKVVPITAPPPKPAKQKFLARFRRKK